MSQAVPASPLPQSVQLALPIATYVKPPQHPKGTSHEAQFAAFHKLNPWVFDTFVILSRDALRSGATKAGIGMFTEVIRWQYGRQTRGDKFKINNNFRSRYVRLLIATHPEFKNLFNTRELRAA